MTLYPPCRAARTVKRVKDEEMLTKRPITGVMALNLNRIFFSETETSQEELPGTSWNELSIIERVGLNRCDILTVIHNIILHLINLILFDLSLSFQPSFFCDSVEMSEKDLEVRPHTSHSYI